MKTKKPNPGSAKALEAGCTCPVMDNHYGKGVGAPPEFWISGDCPVHAVVETKP